MFNLLIWSDPTAWETDQIMRIPTDEDRFNGGYSGHEAASIALDKPDTLRSLEGIPTLLMYESGAPGPTADIVRLGKLREIRASRREATFRFDEEKRCSRNLIQEYANRLGIGPWELNRTHWAIKDGAIPKKMIDSMLSTYDVVLSFAGENRDYVENVANSLKENRVRVFYDLNEEASLWGKNLADHLDLIYRKSAEYCIVFVSSYYKNKMWTQHERRSAMARAIQERSEYILPVRFDDTELEGFLPTVAYISAAKKTPPELAQLVMTKLGKELPANSSSIVQPTIPFEFGEPDGLTGFNLSAEARRLLVTAASADGIVIYTRSSSGRNTQAGRQKLNVPHNPRSEAAWEQAIHDLVACGLLKARGFQDEVYEVTAKGYEVADLLNKQISR